MIKKISRTKKISKRKKNYNYAVRDREAGNLIDKFETKIKAQLAVKSYEKQDKKEGIFEPNFYEITKL